MKKRIIIVFILIVVFFIAYKYSNHTYSMHKQREAYEKSYEGMLMLKDGKIITDAAAVLRENQHVYINIESVREDLPENCKIEPGRLMVKPADLDTLKMDDALKNIAMFSDTELVIPLAQRPSGQFIDSQTLSYISPLIVQIDDTVQLYTQNETIFTGYIASKATLYADDILSLDVLTLEIGESITIVERNKNVYRVVTSRGYTGYVKRENVSQLTAVEPLHYPEVGKSRTTYGKLQTTFNHITNYDALIAQVFDRKINGLDVMMPTALMVNADGSIDNLLDVHYVKTLQNLGYGVHVVINNRFDPDLTTTVLNSPATMERLVNQIELYVRFFGLDGVSIDFENVYLQDQAVFTQLITKLNDRTTRMGIPLSVCVTRPGGSDMWSRFADREAIAKVSDYVILMAYDEHWATSQVAGSVASLGWTASGIEAMLRLVPREKLILGVPTYMRAYTQESLDAHAKLTSVTVSMQNLDRYIKPFETYTEFDALSGQNYYELRDSKGNITKLWAEDKTSVRKRLELVNQYELAGLASWRYGFETENFWRLTQSSLK